MRYVGALVATLAATFSTGMAHAQALNCSVPATLPRPHPELPSTKEPQRMLPIGGYTLAITWAPEYCHSHTGAGKADMECDAGNRFGFTLHGLWPDGVGKEWPQYCTAAALLPQPLIRAHLCATPSAQLMQHEWAKHGSCMGTTPAAYFKRAAGLYAKLHYPDMDALSRAALNAGQLATAVAAANPGIPTNAIRITANKRGWLDELWLCLDKRFAYTRCAAGSGGLPSNASLKVWRVR